MDQLLQMIQSADPTDNQSDSVELLQLEGKLKWALKQIKWMWVRQKSECQYTEGSLAWFFFFCKVYYFWLQMKSTTICCIFSSGACNQMGPLIDQKLDDIDRYCVLKWHVLPTENYRKF